MRYRCLFNFLKLAAGSKGIKKINLFLNFAIFLSIFAITSTLISIYYESKITSLERKITKKEQNERGETTKQNEQKRNIKKQHSKEKTNK